MLLVKLDWRCSHVLIPLVDRKKIEFLVQSLDPKPKKYREKILNFLLI